ncbi:MAG: hypothetical protein ABT02_07530 [Comamonadaceae bacterium SCN 68-20]|nr:MAG: hypothetical protein ABT02_07530 [Comamonadaceae bacterium SCN 68-20]OJX05418.1 MAG: hypothetical protein BGO75_15415 [Burkholderiales bacterium 68-20]
MAHPPRLVYLLGSAQRRLQQWIAVQQERAALSGARPPTPAQAGVLFVLARSDGVAMGQLAEALDLAPSAASGLAQRMEALGWVARRPSPHDARTLQLWLLPAGQAQLPGLRTATQCINQRLTAGFTDAELHTVARWLEHVQTLGAPHD